MILSLLPEVARLSPEGLELVKGSQFQTLFSSLDRPEYRHNVNILNSWLLQLSGKKIKGTGIYVINPHSFFTRAHLAVLPKISFFRAYDGIHFNNSGQALVLNNFILPAIERVSQLRRNSIEKLSFREIKTAPVVSELYQRTRQEHHDDLRAVDEAFALQEELLRQNPAPPLPN